MDDRVTADTDSELIEKGHKWSWCKIAISFARLITDPATIAFAVFTWFVWIILTAKGVAAGQDKQIIIGWIIMSCLFVVFASLKKAISTAIENAKINLEAKASFEKKITGTLETMASEIIEKVKK